MRGKKLKLIFLVGLFYVVNMTYVFARDLRSFSIRKYDEHASSRQIDWEFKLFPNGDLIWEGRTPYSSANNCADRTGKFIRKLKPIEFDQLYSLGFSAFKEQVAEKKGKAIPLNDLKFQKFHRPAMNIGIEHKGKWGRVEVFNPAMPDIRSFIRQVDIWKMSLAKSQKGAIQAVRMTVEQRKSMFKVSFYSEGKEDIFLEFPKEAKEAFSIEGPNNFAEFQKRRNNQKPVRVNKSKPFTVWFEVENAKPNSIVKFNNSMISKAEHSTVVSLCAGGKEL